MDEKKCLHCGEWNLQMALVCAKCGNEFNQREKAEKEKLTTLANKPIEIPLIPIHDDDNPILIFIKRIIRFHQVVFFAIVSFIGWMVAWVAA